jgi:hypothetical protein
MRTSIFLNSNKNIVKFSAMKVFKASLGLPGIFLRLPVGLLITYKVPREPQKASKKPPGSYKKYQNRNPYNIFVAI